MPLPSGCTTRQSDPIGALDAARDFATAPTMFQTMDAVTSIRRIAAGIDPDAAVVKLLDAFTHYDGLEAQLGDRLVAAADVARDAGDVRLETAALHRAAQTQLLHHAESFWSTYQRLADLAEHDDRGRRRSLLSGVDPPSERRRTRLGHSATSTSWVRSGGRSN